MSELAPFTSSCNNIIRLLHNHKSSSLRHTGGWLPQWVPSKAALSIDWEVATTVSTCSISKFPPFLIAIWYMHGLHQVSRELSNWWQAVVFLLIYRSGQPKTYSFSLSKKSFSGSKYTKKIHSISKKELQVARLLAQHLSSASILQRFIIPFLNTSPCYCALCSCCNGRCTAR